MFAMITHTLVLSPPARMPVSLFRRQLLEEAFASPSWVLLDAYTPTVLRPDMHADGLHYCFPGPLDHWITLLYNILLVETAARA